MISDHLKQKLSSPLKIGSLEIKSRVFQSPLSGVTDVVFRSLVRRYAPRSMIYTEMIHAREIYHLKQLSKLIKIDKEEQPISIQLFDSRPNFLAEAAQKSVKKGAKTIDINMGCPVNKITKKGGGASLLRKPNIAQAIVKKVVASVQVPVTIKTRIGWNDQEINILDFAKRMEDSGAAMITIHGRTRAQGYSGRAKWEWITKVKEILSIPVIANGDIFSLESALECLELTGADGVMCSRGTLGYPFLVGEIDYFLQTGIRKPSPTVEQRLECAKEHLNSLWKYKGQRGIYQSRKHLAWYCNSFVGASKLRDRVSRIETIEQGNQLLDEAIKFCRKS